MTILLVDDLSAAREVLKLFLSNFGYIVQDVSTAEAALAQFDPNTHDLVITDNSMPGMSGVEMARIIKLRSPRTPVLMYSGNPPNDLSCLDMVLEKPCPSWLIKQTVDRLLSPKP